MNVDVASGVVPWEIDVTRFPETFMNPVYIDGQALVKLVDHEIAKRWTTALESEVPEKYRGPWREALDRHVGKKRRAVSSREASNIPAFTTNYGDILRHVFLNGWKKDPETGEWTRPVYYHYASSPSSSWSNGNGNGSGNGNSSGSGNYGRLYSYLSGQQLPRLIRNTMFNKCTTLDIKNCYFVLASQFYERHNRTATQLCVLQEYASARDSFLEEFCKYLVEQNVLRAVTGPGPSSPSTSPRGSPAPPSTPPPSPRIPDDVRAAIKEMFLAILFGATSWVAILRSDKFHEKLAAHVSPEFFVAALPVLQDPPARIQRLMEEIKYFREWVASLPYPWPFAVSPASESAWSRVNKCLVHVLQCIESQLLMELVNACNERFPKCVSLLVFDGLEIRTSLVRPASDELASEFDWGAWCVELSDHLYEQFQYRIELCVKPKDPERDLIPLDSSPAEDRFYETFKADFERENCKSLCPVGFWTQTLVIGGNGRTRFQFYKEREFVSKWGHLQHIEVSEKKKGGCLVHASFVRKWITDENIRLYSNAGMYPEVTHCPADTLNTFQGFAADYICLNQQDYEDIKDPESSLSCQVNTVLLLLRRIVESDEHLVFVLDWLAHLFKFPATKPRLALVVTSPYQGTGKDLFFSMFIGEMMIGHEYFKSIGDPEKQLFGTSNATLKNNILMVLDEGKIVKSDECQKWKHYITSSRIMIKELYVDPVTYDDFNHFVMLTNRSQPVILEDKERRLMITSSNAAKLTEAEVAPLLAAIRNPKVVRIFYEQLRARPVSREYEFADNRPASQIYEQLREMTLPIESQFLQEFLLTSRESSTTDASFVLPSSSRQPPLTFRHEVTEVSHDDLYCKFLAFIERGGFAVKMSTSQFTLNLRQALADVPQLFEHRRNWKTGPLYGRFYWRFSVQLLLSVKFKISPSGATGGTDSSSLSTS